MFPDRIRKRLLPCLLCIPWLLMPCRVSAAPNADARTVVPKEVVERLDARRDVTYARYGDRTLEMDIYRPKAAKGELPAVVCIHGGGWAKGNRRGHERLAQAIAARGFVGVTI